LSAIAIASDGKSPTRRHRDRAGRKRSLAAKPPQIKIEQVSRNLGDIGNRLVEFVESLLAPGPVRFLRERGLEIKEAHRRVESYKRRTEIDPRNNRKRDTGFEPATSSLGS
jgi:hypothetical protein